MIETNAFVYSNINSISNLGNLTELPKGQGGLYQDFGVFAYCQQLSSATLPSNMHKLGAYCFMNCINLPNVNLENVTEIGDGCFSYCTLLNINEIKVETLGRRVFRSSGIEQIKMPNILTMEGVYSSGQGNFQQCKKLKKVDIGDSLQSMGDVEFNGCSLLETVIIRNSVVPVINTGVFDGTPSTISIYVPDESVEAYKAAENWSKYADKIKPLSEYVEN